MGNKYIQKLANDLKEYGNGYSVQNLKRMSQFSKEFSFIEISSQLVSQISWDTLTTVIIPKSKSYELNSELFKDKYVIKVPLSLSRFL